MLGNNHSSTLDRILDRRLIAILRAEPAEALPQAVEALVDGGVDVVEVPVTVTGALAALRETKRRLGDRVCLGAGSVLDSQIARTAVEVGCEYLVAPVIDTALIAWANRLNLPWMAGALSPIEIADAWNAGCPLVKVFPGDIGGPSRIAAVRAAMPEVRLLPTGGITIDNMNSYFAAGVAAVGVGSSLVSTNLLQQRAFAAITERAARFSRAAAASGTHPSGNAPLGNVDTARS